MDRKLDDEKAMTLCGTDGERRLSLLGTVLAEGARLIAEGKVSEAVQRSQPGFFALCRLSTEGDEVLELHAPFEVTVGRAASISAGTWHVEDKWMSKAHFRVMATSEDVMEIEDMESLNGTSVNDRPLEGRRRLLRGDTIAAGHSVFVLL